MGLFSSIGKIAGGFLGGPAGAAIGGGLGGVFEQRKEQKAADKHSAQRFVRLRNAALAGGFHPLEALRAGGANSDTSAPRIISSTAATNSFDKLDRILTGEHAADQKRQEVEDNIRRTTLDRLRAGTPPAPTNNVRTSGRIWPSSQSIGTPYSAAAGGLTFGTPVEQEDIEPGRQTITQTGPIGGDTYEDPSQQDMATYEERDGDFEPATWARGAQSILNRTDYNAAIRFTAKRTGMTVQEVHDWVAANPTERRRSLPGLPARAIMNLQEAFKAFGVPNTAKEPTKPFINPMMNQPTSTPWRR